jgi:hypothetical protein
MRRQSIGWIFSVLPIWGFLAMTPISAADGDAAIRFPVDLPKPDEYSEAQKAALATNGFLVGALDYKQIFEVYNRTPPPYFITADSVIQAFSLILEDCIRRQERCLAGDLYGTLSSMNRSIDELTRRVSTGIAGGAPGGKDFGEALDFISCVTGVAGRLLDPSFPVKDSVKDKVEAELRLVLEADELAESPVTDRLRDYSKFKVMGKYAAGVSTARYYQCLKYIQDTPFRVESEKETLAAMILHLYFRDYEFKFDDLGDFYSVVFGQQDDIPLHLSSRMGNYRMSWGDAIPDEFNGAERDKTDPLQLVKHVKGVQAELRTLPLPRINDQILSPEQFNDWQKLTKGVRLVGSSYLPDAELLLKCAEPALPGRPYPNGLDIGLMLNSNRAAELLATTESPATVKHIQTQLASLEASHDALYTQFLDILSGYQDEMTKRRDMQPVFRTPAWRDKELNTTLCGWALMRHAAVLGGKDNVTWMCKSISELVGYVEPVPRFYLAISSLMQRCKRMIWRARVNDSAVRLRAAELVELNDHMQRFGKTLDVIDENFIEKYVDRYPEYYELVNGIWPGFRNFYSERNNGYLRTVEAYAHASKRILAGEGHTVQENSDDMIGPPDMEWDNPLRNTSDKDAIKMTIDEEPIPPEYDELIHICTRLAEISLKQIDHIELASEDEIFIKEYGGHLGRACFYGGNSWMHPKDDMPVTAAVFTNPQLGGVLLVGIGRAKCIKVVIQDPITKQNVVCSGGITLYHEQIGPGRMSDKEWRDALLNTDGPKPAAWISRHIVP